VKPNKAGRPVRADAELIAGMVRGESTAFADLYRKYRDRLHQYALSLIRSRMAAEDVVHDVFVGFAKQAGEGRPPRELPAYLYASVRNRCVDRMRRRREVTLDEANLVLVAAPGGDEARIGLGRLLNRALLALPPEQAEVVVLRTWHDLEFAAIAKLQGTSINTALSRYQYGLTKLRKELGVDA
jgi:RNA polymerase sigma-70 factor (ECF subfamily)